MTKVDILVVGGGPGGLGAAIEASKMGASVLVVDENPQMGGQLYKQIHKFFGSKVHFAGVRGFEIANLLLKEATSLGVKLWPNTRALGLLDDGRVGVLSLENGGVQQPIQAGKIILATGAKENAFPFPGWTLPGVMTAGAAQTLVNIYGVLPGRDIAIVGSGNVGLIVGYQMMQAGARVLGIVEAMPRVTGYGVHAAKINRAGVPLFLSSTVQQANGKDHINQVVITDLNKTGTHYISCDTLLLAVGLTPRTDLAGMFRCQMVYDKRLGGVLPLHNKQMQTSNSRVFICGDLAGVEEASTALDEGRLAGVCAAMDLGLGNDNSACFLRMRQLMESLDALRDGEHACARCEAKKEIHARAAEQLGGNRNEG